MAPIEGAESAALAPAHGRADSNSHRGTDALPKPRAYFRPNGGANRWPNALPFVGTDHLALTTAFGESNRGRIDR